RTHAQGKQRRRHHEKPRPQERPAALPPREPLIAPDDGHKRPGHKASSNAGAKAKDKVRVWAFLSAKSWWLAAMIIPPWPQWRAISAASCPVAAASRVTVGSSNSHNSACPNKSRASDTRRCCPADNRPAAISATGIRPKASRAAATSPPAS